MDKPYPYIRRKRQPLQAAEPVPTVCPHCGRVLADGHQSAPPVPTEQPKPDDADSATKTDTP